MTNHVHLAIEEGEVRISKVMQVLQSSYTQWFNRRHHRVGHLFQGRFKSFVVDRDRYLLGLLRYIHENPVRAGIVERPEAYRWSSDRFFRRGRGPKWLDLDRVLAMLAATRSAATARYRRLMGGPADPGYEQVSAIYGAVKGDEVFALRVMGSAYEIVRPRPGWTAERVAARVAAATGMSLGEMMSASQRRTAASCRVIAAYLGRHRFGIPVAASARLFRREESSLRRGVLSLERRLKADRDLRRQVDAIELGDGDDENTRLHV